MTAVVGTLVTVGAIVLPSVTLVHSLRGDAFASSELLLGATIFRLTLAILGLAIIALGWLPARRLANVGASDPQRRSNAVILLGLLLVALTLRLHALDSGLWLDEILTRVLFVDVPFGTIVTTYDSENQHFLYSILANASLQLFGDHAWALRLPAVVFGVGSVWALYLLGREVASGTEALLSAALLTFSYTHIWFSQNARGYSGLLFWTLMASWLLLRALSEGGRWLWLAYAGATALGVYTHMTMLFVVMGHLVICLRWLVVAWKESRRWAGLAAGFGMAGLLTLLIHSLVLPQMLAKAGREPSLVAEWKNPLWTALEIARGLQIGFGHGVVAIAALAVFGVGLWSYARSRPVVLELLFLPPLLGAAIVIALGHHLWPRFFFFAMGFAALVAIRGAIRLGEAAARLLPLRTATPRRVGALFACALVGVSALAVPAAYGPKQDYQGALAFVEANRADGDAVATAGLAAFPYKRLFRVPWQEVQTAEALTALRAEAKRTWLVYTLPQVLKSVSPDLMKTIERDFPGVREFHGTLKGGTIFVCRSDRPGGPVH